MTTIDPKPPTLGIVVIGRNEGQRLITCLQSAQVAQARLIYVDSGSTDGSVAAARTFGAEVVELDMNMPFTAARARNVGLKALGFGAVQEASNAAPPPTFVQFIDGDCELDSAWLTAAIAFLQANPKMGVVSGRLRERHPEASRYNALCDAEWNTPVGEATSCGGIAMMRSAALAQTTLFRDTMIAGEEPELCVRLLRKGWGIWKLADEMALHDADMHRFGQFWKRMRRGGFAFGLWVSLYGNSPEQLGVPATRSALIWGLVFPLIILVCALIWGPIALVLALIYPAQVARLARRYGGDSAAWSKAVLLTVGKFAECQGVLEYLWRTARGSPARLIEHK